MTHELVTTFEKKPETMLLVEGQPYMIDPYVKVNHNAVISLFYALFSSEVPILSLAPYLGMGVVSFRTS
jgi:hypothetical protein